jgi:hypothetical protein
MYYGSTGSGSRFGYATLELVYNINLFLRGHWRIYPRAESHEGDGRAAPQVGHLLKLVGVLRAGDIYWNPVKR